MPTLIHDDDDEDGDEKHVAGIPLDEGVTTADVACESGASTIGDLIVSLSLSSLHSFTLGHSLSLSLTLSHSPSQDFLQHSSLTLRRHRRCFTFSNTSEKAAQ